MDCFEDQLRRARIMACGGPSSDLAISDQMALQAILERLDALELGLAREPVAVPIPRLWSQTSLAAAVGS